MQHVGVNEDWDIGYRDISELMKWKSFDIVENSPIVGISEKETRKAIIKYKDMFSSMFAKCAKEPEPEPRTSPKCLLIVSLAMTTFQTGLSHTLRLSMRH